MPVDEFLLRAVNVRHAEWLDPIMRWIGKWGYYLPPIGLLAILAWKRRSAAAAVRDGIFAWFFSSLVAEDIVKNIVRRVRPTAHKEILANLHLLGKAPPADSLSFPSGTATSAAAVAAWVWLCWGARVAIPFTVTAVVLSWQRLYVGVHYPTDLLGGWLLGAALAWGVQRYGRWAKG